MPTISLYLTKKETAILKKVGKGLPVSCTIRAILRAGKCLTAKGNRKCKKKLLAKIGECIKKGKKSTDGVKGRTM